MIGESSDADDGGSSWDTCYYLVIELSSTDVCGDVSVLESLIE